MEIENENKRRFKELCGQINRDGMDELMSWLEKSDFYYAPASTRFHGNYSGGLLEHSLNVYQELLRISSAYPEIELDQEAVIVSALFHDLCKVNFYEKEKRNRKNADGAWESYDAYKISEKFCFGGHGSKSLYILTNFIKLMPDEAVAINCHMGGMDGNTSVSDAYEQCPLAWMLHVADEAADFIVEGSKK